MERLVHELIHFSHSPRGVSGHPTRSVCQNSLDWPLNPLAIPAASIKLATAFRIRRTKRRNLLNLALNSAVFIWRWGTQRSPVPVRNRSAYQSLRVASWVRNLTIALIATLPLISKKRFAQLLRRFRQGGRQTSSGWPSGIIDDRWVVSIFSSLLHTPAASEYLFPPPHPHPTVKSINQQESRVSLIRMCGFEADVEENGDRLGISQDPITRPLNLFIRCKSCQRQKQGPGPAAE